MLSTEQSRLLIQHLSQYISDHKKQLIDHVLDERTRHVTLVLEDIFQSQNASAVFRTAECFGIQDIHLIENINKYSVNKKVLKGANKWLTVNRHKEKSVNNTIACINFLKQKGYQIVATVPSANKSFREVDIKNKLAIIMGNELHGISDEAIEMADEKVTIPMYGFTESLNLSVSAALCISEIIWRMKNSDIPWRLNEEEQEALKLEWYRKSIRNAEIIERIFLSSNE